VVILLAAAAQLALVGGFRRLCGGLFFFDRALGKRHRCLLDGALQGQETVAGTGNAAFDQDDVLVREHPDDPKVQDGCLLVAVLARHFLTAGGTARGRRHADRTATAFGLVRAVTHGAGAGKVVSPHDAGEATALARGRDIDELAILKDVGRAQGLADLEALEERLFDAKLANDPLGVDAGLLKAPASGLLTRASRRLPKPSCSAE